MRIYLSGAHGGIGTAIREALDGHSITYHQPGSVTMAPYDWLVCSHGFIGESDPVETFDVNTLLSIDLAQNLAPSKGVIFISSTAGITGNSMFPIYAASKAALNCYVTSMAKKKEVGYFAVCPGPTATKMWRNLELGGEAQPPDAVANVVRDIINGAFNSGDIITVRNGVVSV